VNTPKTVPKGTNMNKISNRKADDKGRRDDILTQPVKMDG